jgi:mitochondrial fission protein ELM1
MPVAWIIAPYRAGERKQVRALGTALQERLGVDVREITLAYRLWAVWPHLLAQASLAGIRSRSRQHLQAPWPDLVITCGVRNEPVARWLRRASGGRTRYVHVGRPWGPLDGFDLLITTPQYRVPEHPRVLNNDLTLHAVEPGQLAAAADSWRAVFESLPAPRLAVLAGGDSGPFTFGPVAARRLADAAAQWVRESAGSLLVSTSARTSPAAGHALRQALESRPELQGRLYFYCYADAQGDSEALPANPYLGMLALADAFLVTADSIGMLSELTATGRPIHLFDLGGMRDTAASRSLPRDPRLGALLFRWLMAYFPARLSRDITRVHQALIAHGLASWDDAPPGARTAAPSADLERAVERVAALLDPA